MGIRFAGETRRDRSREVVRRGISPTPDMGLRHGVIGAVAPLGAVAGFVVTLAGVGLTWVTGEPAAGVVALRAGTVAASWSIVVGFRQLFEGRDHRAWKAAGEPDAWRPSVLSQPVAIDLAVWIVLSIVLATVVSEVGVTRGL